MRPLAVAASALALALAACGGDHEGATTTPPLPPGAAAAAERFLAVYVGEHQTGRLSPAGRRTLRASSTPEVFAALERQSRGIPATEDRCEPPRVVLLDGEGSTVVADARIRCTSNPEIGYGVRLERQGGRWVVTSLGDARCDADVAPRSRARC